MKPLGCILWLFGFTGSHRSYFGKPISGTIYFFTLGLLGIGWLIVLFLIPSLDRQANLRFRTGHINYSVAWVLLTFLGLFGVHRMYMGKWFTGIIYLLTAGIFEELPLRESQVMTILTEHGPLRTFSNKMLQPYDMGTPSLHKALSNLIKKDLILKGKGREYYVADNFLHEWIRIVSK